MKFELLTAEGKTVTWEGNDGEDAAMRAADCLGVTITAWRYPRFDVVSVNPRQIIG